MSKFRSTVSRDILDMFDQYFPYGGTVLDYLRRARTDARSLAYAVTRHRQSEKLTWMSMEVANICNSNCIFCAYKHQGRFQRRKGFMSKALFQKAINDFTRAGGTHVNMTPFSGEPLLDPDFINKLEQLKQNNVWAGFFTNGTLLNTIDLERLMRSGVDAITVSSAPFDRNMYTLLYRNDKYADMLQGLRKLLETRNQCRKDLAIGIAFRSHIPMRKVLALPDFQLKIAPLMTGADRDLLIVNTRGFDTWGGQITAEDMVGIMRLALPPGIKKRPCLWTFNPYVMWNGQVRACACRFAETQNSDGVDELYIGNIMESSLLEIWEGQALQRVRQNFSDGTLPPVCRHCTMYKPC